MNPVFTEIYQQVWKEIFPNQPALDIEMFKGLYLSDIELPIRYACQISNKDVFSSSEYGYQRFISQEETRKRADQDNFLEPKREINSLSDILNGSKDLFLFKGSRALNSDVLEESDDIYSSNYVYNSTHIYSCNKILYSNNCVESEYLIASKGSNASSFGIRVIDSKGTSNCFDVSFLGKSANCYFCHDGYDLRDCLFCFHLTSKQYCIANVQYEKEEYFKLKDIILTDYFKQLESAPTFVKLSDL